MYELKENTKILKGEAWRVEICGGENVSSDLFLLILVLIMEGSINNGKCFLRKACPFHNDYK